MDILTVQKRAPLLQPHTSPTPPAVLLPCSGMQAGHAKRKQEASPRPGCTLALLSQQHSRLGRSSACLLSSPEDTAALPPTNMGQGTTPGWLRDPRHVPDTAQLNPDDISRLQEQVCRGQLILNAAYFPKSAGTRSSPCSTAAVLFLPRPLLKAH